MHRLIKTLLFIALPIAPTTAFADPISCTVKNNTEVHITMQTPHPQHALVHRPDGKTVWLQTSPDFVHRQKKNFSHVAFLRIDSESEGTVWVNGVPKVQRILKGAGKYHFYVAENTETERENTFFIECYFVLEKNP